MNIHTSIQRAFVIAALAATAAVMSGCATTTTLVEHHKLEASTKMSSSIFLNPVAAADQTVFVQVHNTTDKGGIGLKPALEQAVRARGWRVVDDPAKAHDVLQVNVLQAGKIKKNALQSAMAGGYGGVLGSAAGAAGIAALAGGNGVAVGSAGLAVGAADWLGSMLVSNVTYSVITDVRVLERGAKGQTFTVHHNTGINSNAGGAQTRQQVNGAAILGALMGTGRAQTQGSSSNVTSNTSQSYATQSQYMIHQTRVVSFANQVNLDWQDAEPVIKTGLVNTVSGLF